MTIVRTSLKVVFDYDNLKVTIRGTGLEASLDVVTLGSTILRACREMGRGTPKFDWKEEQENASRMVSETRKISHH